MNKPSAPLQLKGKEPRYKTKLKEAYAKGPNFAGYLTVVIVGCGTSCQYNFVVNNMTGKVVGFFQTSMLASYTILSNLLILDPPASDLKEWAKNDAQCDNIFVGVESKFMVWNGHTFKEIFKGNLYKDICPKHCYLG